jgi:hypothetical protein
MPLRSPVLRRVDEYFVRTAPLEWRARVHLFLIFSLVVASGALFLLGSVYPVSHAHVPTMGEIRNVMLVLYGAGGCVLAKWALRLHRTPLHEQRIRTHVRLGVAYAACILSVLVNPLAFLVPTVTRIANLYPDLQNEADYEFHNRFHFWTVCGYPATTEHVQANRDRVERALADYGLTRKHEWSSCYSSEFYTLVWSDSRKPVHELRDRISSVWQAKRFRDARTGSYASFTAPLRLVPLSLVLALMLVLATYPRGALHRRLSSYDPDMRWSGARLPAPSFLRRLDDNLISHRPLLWAAGAHRLAYFASLGTGIAIVMFILVGTAVAGSVRALWDVLQNDAWRQVAFAGTMMGGVLLSLVWIGLQRNTPLRALTLRGNFAAIGVQLLGLVIGPLLSCAMIVLIDGFAEVLALQILITIPILWILTSLAYVAKYQTLGRAFLLLVLAFTLLWVAVSLLKLSITVIFVGWVLLAMQLTWRQRARKLERIDAALASVHILLVPWVLYGLAAFIENKWLGSEGAVILALLAISPLYLLLVTPGIRTLVRGRYWPEPA